MSSRVVIIGGGIVGLATAYRLLEKKPGLSVTVLEKESGPGRHQSTHNSGVLHAGLYYKPGSLKARMAVSGIRQMVAFCQKHGISHEICGKLVVAVTPEEQGRLNQLRERAEANGLAGVRLLSLSEMREIEPYVGGLAALHVPEEGIVDYEQVCTHMVKEIQSLGGEIKFNSGARAIIADGNRWKIETASGEVSATYLINCAGLHSDRVAKLAGATPAAKIVPFRGEYYKLKPDRQNLVRNLIYPVPDLHFPFLGVHFTRLIHGGIEAGPNAVLAMAREGYRKSDINLGDLWDALTYPGLWKFLEQHRQMCWEEIQRSFSKKLFCASLQKLVPDVREEDLTTGGAGVRAQAMFSSGELVQDFSLVQEARALHVVNAPSPGATASLAIGAEIVSSLPTECLV
jgi:L-2-hydroxyglutarate oxidase LhgO